MLKTVRDALHECANEADAKSLQRFFKTGPGEYGEGDRFIGIRVPVLRKIVAKFQDISLKDTLTLLHSGIHEERSFALATMVGKYRKGTTAEQKHIYELYLANTRYINNWDLVDSSAEHIVGAYLADKSREQLYELARSSSLWERRIAILATFHYIKRNELAETLVIAKILRADSEDLIHKAVGWMLREVGKRDQAMEEVFLNKHYQQMPRTMLRYAIERFPEKLRQQYLKGEIS